MKDNNGFEGFYNLEKRLFEQQEKERQADLRERKKSFQSNSMSYTRRSIISKEKLTMIVIFIILMILIFPIAQAQIIESKISNVIQESDEIRKDIADSIIFNDKYRPIKLPKFITINKNSRQITIDIGQKGKKIVNGTGYIYLDPVVIKDKDTIKWQCRASGTGIKENYLPG